MALTKPSYHLHRTRKVRKSTTPGQYHQAELRYWCLQKDKYIYLKALLMKVTLRLASEPSCSDLAPSMSASVQSAPLALTLPQHHSPAPVPRKPHKKQQGSSPASSKDRKGMAHKGPMSGHLPSLEHQVAASPPKAPSPTRNPLTPGSSGDLCV